MYVHLSNLFFIEECAGQVSASWVTQWGKYGSTQPDMLTNQYVLTLRINLHKQP